MMFFTADEERVVPFSHRLVNVWMSRKLMSVSVLVDVCIWSITSVVCWRIGRWYWCVILVKCPDWFQSVMYISYFMYLSSEIKYHGDIHDFCTKWNIFSSLVWNWNCKILDMLKLFYFLEWIVYTLMIHWFQQLCRIHYQCYLNTPN